MLADIRYALRALWRAPWYAATVIGVIALGMALATTVFAVVDGVLFKPLPYPDPSQLVAIEPGFATLPAPTVAASVASARRVTSSVSPLDVANWRAAAPDIAITAFRSQRWGGLGEGVNQTSYGVATIEPGFFDTVGVHPAVGGFVDADFDHEDKLRPVVITHSLWRTRFHAMPDVVGQQIISDPIEHRGVRVVGVMPAGFVFPSSSADVSFLTPFVPDRARAQDPTFRNFFDVIARVPAGTSADALRVRLEAGSAVTAAAFPVRPKPAGWSDRGWRMQGPYDQVNVAPLATRLGRDERPLFSAVFAAAVVLLLLGGLNISGLMTARGLDRARELTLRRALGASGASIARLVFVEAVLPIGIGALAGLALAVPLLRLGARLLPEELVLLRTQSTVAIDPRVVFFMLISALVLAVLTTIWPIRRALSPTGSALAEGGRGSSRTRSIGRTVIIVAQVAAALVLTVAGGLLVTSILVVYAHRPPLRTEGVVVLGEQLLGAGNRINKAPERTPRINTLIETIRRVPGVELVALTDQQTLVGGNNPSWFDAPPQASNARLVVSVHAVTSDFYRVLEPQLVIGRFPTDAELTSDAPVIVISESVARAYWPQASPIGQTLNARPELTPYAVVGVVRDVPWNSWDTEVASIYGSYARLSRWPHPTVFIRTRMSVSQTLAAVTSAMAAVDPLISTERAGALEEVFADTVRPRRFQSWLFGSFAICALIIVGVGILGLIAMATASRTKEMGIRLALGATRDHLIGLLLREQLRAVVAGVIIGSLVSAWAVRFLKVYLYQITAYDPRVWAAAVVAILATAAVGTLIPALRASRVDPVRALSVE